jgi:TonB-linked SusC/RagA family outer membrane protein
MLFNEDSEAPFFQKGVAAKTLLIMKMTVILLLAACLNVSAEGYSQVTLSERNVSLQKVFKQIQKQTGFDFLYSVELLQRSGNTSISVKDVSLEKALDICLQGKPLTYSIEDRTVVIRPKKETVSEDISAVPPTVDVRGKVVNERGEPIEGVSVIVKGTNTGTTTGFSGEFSITGVANDATLVISSVNTETVEIKVDGRAVLPVITAKTKIISENSVVINTGFQTISKARATGAYDKVDERILSKRPYPNLANALVGQVAGMVADPATGFTIRGRSSLSGASDRVPLLVVDGFPIEGGFSSINPNDVRSVDVLKDAAATSIYGARAANGVIVVTTKGTGPKGKINVAYNAFMSFGENIDLDYYMNIADPKTQIEFEDRMYQTFKGTTFISDPYNQTNGSFRGARSPYTTLLIELEKGNITREFFDKERSKMLSSSYKNDYEDYLLNNYFFQQHNLIISGTGEKNSYKFSALYDNDQSTLQFNNSNKVMLNFTDIFNISKSIRYQIVANITSYNNSINGVSLGQVSSVTAPWTRLFDEEGNYSRMHYQNYEPLVKQYERRLPYSMRYNILEESQLKDNSYKGNDLRIQNQFDFRIANGFKFTPMFQYEQFTDKNVSIFNEKMYASRNYSNLLSKLDTVSKNYLSQIPRGGIYRRNGETRRESLKFRAQLDYTQQFNNRHEVVALAGLEVINTKTELTGPDLKFGYNSTGLNYALFDYAVDRLDMFNTAVLENSISYDGALLYDYKATGFRQNYRYNERFLAGYANGSYTFDKKYTASFSLRTDASNYVAKSVRDKFSPFYSVGALWNVKNENFLKNVKFVNRLAVRGSYGVTGLAAGKNSVKAVTVFSSQASTPETGNLPNGFLSGRDNDFLTWEKTYSTNIGTDFTLWGGILSGSVDLYRRHTKDVLSRVQTSQVIQSTTFLDLNLGEILNKGIELSLGTTVNFGRGFNWTGTVNADYNYNEVLRYDYINPTLANYLGSNRGAYIPGRPTDYLYMIKIVGTTKDGYFVQQKKNGELVVANSTANSFSNFGRSTIPGLNVDQDDRIYYQGRTTPPATFGFTNTFSYKGFSLMAVITGRFGHVFRMTDQWLNYSLNNNNYSATGLASMQGASLTATTKIGNVFPSVINQAMLGELSSMRNFYSEEVVADASHIRLNEIYFGYQFPESIMGNGTKFFKSVNLFTQARNLGLLWKANDSGQDPEYPIGSVKPTKVLTFGVKLLM